MRSKQKCKACGCYVEEIICDLCIDCREDLEKELFENEIMIASDVFDKEISEYYNVRETANLEL